MRRAGAALVVLLGAAPASAAGRDGEGLIQFAPSLRAPLNAGFLDEARGNGEGIQGGNFNLAPGAFVTFGYFADEQVEIGIEGGYSRDWIGVTAANPWLLNEETLQATVRYVPWTDWNLWPYVGAAFGYSLNAFNGTALPHYEDAEGFGGALFAGSGWDLSAHFGVSLELRWTIASIVVPGFTHAFDVGGPTILAGFYWVLPHEDELSHPATPPSLE